MRDVASHSNRSHYARLRSSVRVDLYVAADRGKGTVGAVQDSLGETCGSNLLVDWEANIICGYAPVTGKSVNAHFKSFLAAAASGAAR